MQEKVPWESRNLYNRDIIEICTLLIVNEFVFNQKKKRKNLVTLANTADA
jgi:hypothetical protein